MRSKLFTAAAVLALVVPVAADAQSVAVTASATVQATITAGATHQLNFGTLDLGQEKTIDGLDGLSAAGVAGRGQVQVQHNSNVNVKATVPTELTRSPGNTLPFSATCATSTISGDAGTDVGGCGSFQLTTAPGTSKTTFITIGGTVLGNAAAGIGTFTGDVVFTFTAAN